AIERLGTPAPAAMAGARRGIAAVSSATVAAVVSAAAASFASFERNSSGIRSSEAAGGAPAGDGVFLRRRGGIPRFARFLGLLRHAKGERNNRCCRFVRHGYATAVGCDAGAPAFEHDAAPPRLKSNPFLFERFVNEAPKSHREPCECARTP